MNNTSTPTPDNTARFDGKGEIYAKARPRYAAGLFDYLKNDLRIPEGSVFADIGSGTGIFSEQLLGCGYRVFAVEPNADMRRVAEDKLARLPGFTSIDGSDAHTGLPSGSVDCVTAAQAFHWFDAEAFRAECRRILKPGGKVIIIYNSRVEDAAPTLALAELRRSYNPAFHGFSNGVSHRDVVAFFAGGCDIFRADNTQIYDRQGYINRALSSSYSLRAGDEKFDEYLAGLNGIFDRFAVDGSIAVPTETVACIGTV